METTTAGQIVTIGRLVVDKQRSVGWTQQLIDSGLLADLFDIGIIGNIDRAKFRAFCNLPALGAAIVKVLGTFMFCDLNLQRMHEFSNCSYVNKEIIDDDLFPDWHDGQEIGVDYEYAIDYPECVISTSAELKRITEIDPVNSWQPGGLSHLLAYSALTQQCPRGLVVVALGSTEPKRGRCPMLFDEKGHRRNLGLSYTHQYWMVDACFLLVRKKLLDI